MPRIYTLFNRSIWNIPKKDVSLQRQEENLGYPGRIPRGAAAIINTASGVRHHRPCSILRIPAMHTIRTAGGSF